MSGPAQRGFTDSAGRSVLHDTKLKMTPITVDARWNIGGRYRQRPGGRNLLKPVFYLGGGVGVNFWEYREVGDFVFEDTPGNFIIAYDRFKETGTAFQFHGMAGVEWPLSRGFNLFVEGRYSVPTPTWVRRCVQRSGQSWT